jgi:hypothetical protein
MAHTMKALSKWQEHDPSNTKNYHDLWGRFLKKYFVALHPSSRT